MAMAAPSFGGASNMMLMRNSGPNSLVAMLSSCNPHVGFQVPRSTGGLEDAIAGCGGQKRAFYPTFEDQVELEDVDEDIGFTSHGGPVEKKRRLSFDQVRSLERNFEMENKLEPERKMQLAKDLGLQPRQVAVWFQNRRARWKTKQLERDYEMLNSGYLKLKADFETALREKDALKAEVQRLSGDSQSVDSTPPCKSEVAKAKCAPVAVEDSTVDSSSELLDSDSPRTTAGTTQQQALPQQQQQQQQALPQQQQQQQEELFVTAAAPEEAFNVKMEDGPFQVDPSCNYFLPPMMPLPWWDSFA